MSASAGSSTQRIRTLAWTTVRSPRPIAALGFAAFALVPILGNTDATVGIFLQIMLFGMAAIALNFTLGTAGEFAIGQIGVFVAGAYIAGVLTARHGWGVWPAVAMATFASAAIGVAAAAPGLRVGGWPFALTSLLFAIVVPDVVKLMKSQTGGQEGLLGIPIPSAFGHSFSMEDLYVLALVSTLIILFVLWLLERSLWGTVFSALRNSHVGAEANGLSTLRLRIAAYSISSLIAGYAGAIYAFTNGFLSPSSFSLSLSITLIAAVVIGGLGTLSGPLVGMAILQYIPTFTSNFSKYALLVYGAILILGMLLIPTGLIPTGGRIWRRFLGGFGTGTAEGSKARDERHPPSTRSAAEVVAESKARAKIPNPSDRKSLRVEHVTQMFGGVAALNDISLTAKPGEITAVIGANGSGKTTLLNIISGYYAPTEGKVTVGDSELTGLNPHRIAKRGVSRSFQTPILIPQRTTLENVVCATFVHKRVPLFASLLNTSRTRRDVARRREEAHNLLSSLGLDHLAETQGDALTPGDQRLVEVACAIARQPSVILLDEPAAGLIGAEVEALADLLKALRDEGYTVLVIEHNVNLVMSLADHIVVLNQGNLIAEGVPQEIRENAAVIESYLGQAADVA
jgi:branched-chain amino acid transport system permease protein